MLLNPRLAATTRDLGPGLGVMGSLALVTLVYDHSLVDQGWVHGNIENSVIEFDAIQRVATLILN